MKDDHALALCGAGVLSDSRVLDDPSSLPPCRRSPRVPRGAATICVLDVFLEELRRVFG